MPVAVAQLSLVRPRPVRTQLFIFTVAAASFVTLLGRPAESVASSRVVSRVSNPRPCYPDSAKKHGIGGSGVFVLHVDVATGTVRHVEIEKSTGVPILDKCAVETFGRWRFEPHTVVVKVRIPITFVPDSPVKKK